MLAQEGGGYGSAVLRSIVTMIISNAQPAIPDFQEAFLNYWTKSLFSTGPADDQITSVFVSTYMRLVESCVSEYRSAELMVESFWAESSSFKLSAMHRAVTHYETCITNAQRAIRSFNKLRRSKHLRPEVRAALAAHKHTFHKDQVSRRLGDIRDLIHHFDEALGKGEVTKGEPVLLQPTGPEAPVDTNPGQTVKTIDRLKIGPHEILLADLAQLLTEMGECAEIISQFRVDQPHVLSGFVRGDLTSHAGRAPSPTIRRWRAPACSPVVRTRDNEG
ncbi:hypothetical protein QTH97_29640 [Variovorax sp. J22R24]|uniref:hypothetical protein n=1 Tax=Variovorax gracilis TaxID=3053502 RepID=UPI002575B707|nr:hypothetical protein [Variovorax sp. J22R24]MDM0109136.1 hypothetical protein [Variovorax sp. J22R24]